jgi:DNA ligase-1
MTNKNSRPSPSESATLFSIGTKKIGNDNFMYKVILTSNNIKRWVKDKENNSKKSTKKRSTKKSIKKRSTKKSTKKRSTKKSTKKRSTKKSTKKRSVKKSTKKRSTKKSTKKRSVKKSTKKRSVKKNTKKRTNKKKSPKRSKTRSTKKRITNKKKSPKRSKTRNSSSKSKPINIPISKKFNKNTFGTMLAHKYNGQEPTGYYISEKLDGIRAIYDGESDSFMSRNNKPFFAPKSFTEKFPKDLVLDGELYTKRKDFAGTGIFRKKIPNNEEWKKAIFKVFDIPLINLPFNERYALMKKLLKGIPYLEVVEHIIVKDRKHMDTIHQNLVKLGAEGTMLRHPDSFYENKRSHHLLKVKDFFDDEVKIIGYEFGEGRNEGRLGALHVKWLDPKMGTNEFKVGSGFDDKQRDNYKKLFPLNSIITIKYWEIDKHSKRPRFPIFLRIKEKE